VFTAPYIKYCRVNSTILKIIMKMKKTIATHIESIMLATNNAIKPRSYKVPQTIPVISRQLMHFLS